MLQNSLIFQMNKIFPGYAIIEMHTTMSSIVEFLRLLLDTAFSLELLGALRATSFLVRHVEELLLDAIIDFLSGLFTVLALERDADPVLDLVSFLPSLFL